MSGFSSPTFRFILRAYLEFAPYSLTSTAYCPTDGVLDFPDGTTFKEITPEHYVEGHFMFRKDDKYYFMWSEGGWTGPNYSLR